MKTRMHFVGIEGVGMNALAEAVRALGAEVSGCDLAPGPASHRLAREGVRIWRGHDPAHLAGAERLVISNAVPEDHPEVVAARRAGIPVERRIETLARVLAVRPSLGVSGTHGKTTTTAMLAHVLEAAGQDPMALVGARVPGWRGGFRPGKGPMVAEIDESDRRFPKARVELAVLTNLEDDHVGDPNRPTYHESEAALFSAMACWLGEAKAVVLPADPGLADLRPEGARVLDFGLDAGAVRAEELVLTPTGARFTLVFEGRPLGPVALRVPGLHNVKNALAAAAAGLLFGLPFEAVARGLGAFSGTGRRFEPVGEYRGALIYDDYAHHPTELAATLEAARGLGRRVRAVFQPHRYLRTARFLDRFAEALKLADEAIVLEVYPAGEPPIPGVSGAALAERARSLGANARFFEREEAFRYLAETLNEGDLLVTLGAGDVGKLARRLAEEARAWR